MFEPASRDRVVVQFTGAQAGAEPLTWGQKAIYEDMQASGNQFSMPGRMKLPEGSTVEDTAALLSGLMSRHAALRMRLGADDAGRLCQQVAASGQIGLDILTLPGDTDRAGIERYIDHLWDTWPLARFDFYRDWPLRMAVLRHRDACLHLVWVLSHLVADGGAHLLLLDDMLAAGAAARAASEPRHPDILDVARSEQAPQLRQLSGRAMRYWAKRTGTDVTRVTLAVIATAIGRATGVHPLTIKVMVNNRFRPGLADVIAPIAENSILTIDTAGASVDEVVARARTASLTAGMRAYYDPDELGEVMARLDAERGHPARVTCRVNDQRAMIMRADEKASLTEVTPEQVRQRLAETSLTWLGPREHMHEQVNILVEPRPPGVVSLHMMWDRWSLTNERVEVLLRGVEEVAVEAAFDPAAPARVFPRPPAWTDRHAR